MTLQQIAATSGVHPSSVSRILNGKETQYGIGRQAVEKVLGAARALGYRPNAAAQATRTGRFNAVALLQSQAAGRSTLPMPLLQGICDDLAEQDMHLLITRLPDAKLTDASVVPRLLRMWLADGLLVNYTDRIPEKMIALIRSHQMPSVWMNTKLEADCIHLDDRRAGREATEHLLALDHQRIAYLDVAHSMKTLCRDHYSARDRAVGYSEAMKAAGLTPHVMRFDRRPSEGEVSPWVCQNVFDTADRPTAVIGYGWKEVSHVAVAALQRGVQLGKDLSLMHMSTAGDPSGSRLGGITFTHMAAELRAMAREAVQMLLEKIVDPQTTLAPRTLPFTHIEGLTTGRRRDA
ncbi:MAG: LacI family DNA-binding transcriptional regulator [Phycisphaeraceae bacterium]